MKRTTLVAALVFAVTAAGATNLRAEQRLLERMNPFRIFRHRPALPAEGPSDASANRESAGLQRRGIHPAEQTGNGLARRSAEWQREQYRARSGEDAARAPHETGPPAWTRAGSSGEDGSNGEPQMTNRERAQYNGGPLRTRTREGQPPTLEELQAHLESRGVDPAQIEARIQRTTAAQAHGNRFGQTGKYGEGPSLEQLRAEMKARGMDPAAIEAQVTQRQELRQREGKFARQAHGINAPSNEQVRSRLERSGLAPDTVQQRLGALNGNAGGHSNNGQANRAGLGRLRR